MRAFAGPRGNFGRACIGAGGGLAAGASLRQSSCTGRKAARSEGSTSGSVFADNLTISTGARCRMFHQAWRSGEPSGRSLRHSTHCPRTARTHSFSSERLTACSRTVGLFFADGRLAKCRRGLEPDLLDWRMTIPVGMVAIVADCERTPSLMSAMRWLKTPVFR